MLVRSKPRFLVFMVGAVYAYGVLLGSLGLVWQLVIGKGFPHWVWWQFLLAPLGIGATAACGEWLFEKVQSTTGFGAVGQSRGKRFAHLLLLAAVLAALVIGSGIYNIAAQ